MSMGALFGGGSKNQTTTTKYTALQLQTSAQGLIVPYSPGQRRIGSNLIWDGDFVAIPEKNGGKKGGGKGGKGGDGKGAGGVVYDYYVSVIMALAEGPINSIGTVWEDKNTTSLSALGLTLFTGTASQAPWTYMTTRHPSEARSYAYTAYLAGANYSLGKSPNLPNHNFEGFGLFAGSMLPYSPDCNYADILKDYLTNPQYSLLLSGTIFDSTWTNYKTYCQAQGLFMSPAITTAEQISSTIDRWAELSNSWIFWSGAGLRCIPLGDSTITNNGVTYTPSITPLFDLTYDDFIGGSGGAQDAPITVTRSDPADAPNRVRLETTDRSNAYNRTVCEWRDQGLVDQFGVVDASNTQADEICDNNVGMLTAQLIGFRGAYIRNNYDFKLGWEIGSVLEPGDIVTLTEPHIGLSRFPVRVKQMDEDQDGNWSITAEEFPQGIGTSLFAQPFQTVTSFSGPNFNVLPGDINPPAIFEPDSSLTNGIAQVFVSCSGGQDWGGAVVMISFDNVNFQSIGSITNPATQGQLTANLPNHAPGIDTTSTLSVDTTASDQVLPTIATTDDADNLRTLVWITAPFSTVAPSTGELLAYGSAVAGTGAFDTDLTYLNRGAYNTTPSAHSTSDFFTRIDLASTQPPGNTLLIYDLPPQYIGKTIYLKFVSLNRFGNAIQDESSAPVYSYTPIGAGFGGGTGGVPLATTGVSTTGLSGGITVEWTANNSADNVQLYKVYRANGHGATFGSASLVGQVNALNFSDMGLASGAQFTYWVVAENTIGDSAPSAGVDATVATTTASFTINTSENGLLSNAQVVLDYVATSAFHLPTGLTGSFGGVSTGGTSPAITATFNIFKGASNIGTMTINTGVTPGANSATFSFTTQVNFVAGDHLRITGPSPADANLKSIFISLLATAP